MSQREIKFRAWDGSHMRYLSDDTHLALFSGAKRVPWRIYSNRDGTMLTDSQYGGVLMQFTGLLDRMGNEIYEGDVVRMPVNADPSAGDPIALCVVEFNGPWLMYRDLYSNWSDYIGSLIGFRTDTDEDAEVIGNIHENPELLKP